MKLSALALIAIASPVIVLVVWEWLDSRSKPEAVRTTEGRRLPRPPRSPAYARPTVQNGKVRDA